VWCSVSFPSGPGFPAPVQFPVCPYLCMTTPSELPRTLCLEPRGGTRSGDERKVISIGLRALLLAPRAAPGRLGRVISRLPHVAAGTGEVPGDKACAQTPVGGRSGVAPGASPPDQRRGLLEPTGSSPAAESCPPHRPGIGHEKTGPLMITTESFSGRVSSGCDARIFVRAAQMCSINVSRNMAQDTFITASPLSV
jgi:hypothetical protein